MQYLGDYADDSTVRIFFTTSDGSGGAVAPSTAFEAADIVIYKNNSATQKATTNGITMTSPFDTVTGLHLVEIDCSNDTGDAGFWATGNDYSVVLSPDETVDSQIVVAAIAQFSIENRIVSSVTGSVSSVTTAVETDSASRTASQADVSSLATASALTTVDTEVGQIKAKTDQLTFTVANQVDANALTGASDATAANQTTIINHLTDVKGTGWVAADNLAEIAEDVTGLNGEAMRGTDGAYTGTPATAGDIADAVWDEALSGHNSAGSTGKALRQMKEGIISIEGSVNDASATTTTFVSNLTESTDGFYHDKVIVFISGALTGQARHIETYVGSTKSITVSQAFTSAPANADEFLILATHEHSINEIQDGLATSSALATVDANVDQILLDTGTDGVVISTAQAQALADEVLKRSVTNTQDSADAHSLAAIVLGILESSRSSTTWTIKKTTGSTFTTKTLTLDSEADPVIGVD